MAENVVNIDAMSSFAKVDLLVAEGEISEKAAKLLVEVFSGRSSPELKEVLDAVHNEITRKDLATKADLIAALEPYATKTDIDLAIAQTKLELVERIGRGESNLRGWVIGVGALAVALANLDKLAAVFGLG